MKKENLYIYKGWRLFLPSIYFKNMMKKIKGWNKSPIMPGLEELGHISIHITLSLEKLQQKNRNMVDVQLISSR